MSCSSGTVHQKVGAGRAIRVGFPRMRWIFILKRKKKRRAPGRTQRRGDERESGVVRFMRGKTLEGSHLSRDIFALLSGTDSSMSACVRELGFVEKGDKAFGCIRRLLVL